MNKLLALAVALIAPVFVTFAETVALSDAEIVNIAMVVNRAEINAGNLASSISSNPDVAMYGRRLAEDHAQLSSLFDDWANKQNITPQSSSISDMLKADEEKRLEHLESQRGILFDLDYVNHEVEFHQRVLDIWDQKLASNAKSEGLKSLLSDMRLMLVDQLEQAKLIKASLGRKK